MSSSETLAHTETHQKALELHYRLHTESSPPPADSRVFFKTEHTPVLLPRYVLKGFSEEGRDLTDDETKAFLKAADKDGDGKIGIDGERTEG